MLQFIKNLLKPKPVSFPRDGFMSFYLGTGLENNVGTAYDNISAALTELGIFTGWTLLGALATVRTEVGRPFLPIPEYGTGQQYEGRTDLGNVYPGDGPKYKGRGYIQLTGRSNYENYGLKLGIDLVDNPDLALLPQNAAKILALYFKNTGANIACDNNDWAKVRRLVNGGSNGLALFQSIIKQYSQKTITVSAQIMETVKVIYTFKPVDKTYVVFQGYKDGALNETSVWTSETDLTTNDEVLAFARTKVEAGVEVELAA